jgi:hypothetical protein
VRSWARRRWTERKIIEELTELYQKGVAITVRGLIEAGRHQLAHAINHFGGLRRARRLAGLPRPSPRRVADAPDAAGVLAEIRRRQAAGEPLAWSRIPLELQQAGQRHFGTWREAIGAAGLDYEKIKLTRSYTEAQLLQLVRRLAREQPAMTMAELRRHRISSTLRDRFGSLVNAARRAGVENWPLRPQRG